MSVCVLCGGNYAIGNNPEPVVSRRHGLCCNRCYDTTVTAHKINILLDEKKYSIDGVDDTWGQFVPITPHHTPNHTPEESPTQNDSFFTYIPPTPQELVRAMVQFPMFTAYFGEFNFNFFD